MPGVTLRVCLAPKVELSLGCQWGLAEIALKRHSDEDYLKILPQVEFDLAAF
jgi:hypothetical protein